MARRWCWCLPGAFWPADQIFTAVPLFYWLSTAGFACVHLLNFDEGSLYVLLPLVLPQFVTGSILGYLRVHYGLWAAMLLHALHNGTAMVLVFAGMLLAG